MKLQKRLSRRVGKKEYVKWVVTIPPSEIDKLHWKEGETLTAEAITNGNLVIKKGKGKRSQ